MDHRDEPEAAAGKIRLGRRGQIHDPRFRKVAERIFDPKGTRVAPYAGIPTLLNAPILQIDWQNPDFGDLQVALARRTDGPRRRPTATAPASGRARFAASSGSAPTITCSIARRCWT